MRPEPGGASAALHLPLRPLWICRIDLYPWPCANARLDLTNGYRDMTISLSLFLASQFVEALNDLHTIDPTLGPPPDPRVVYERFMGWVPVRRTP